MLNQTSFALLSIKKHFEENGKNPELESYLVQYLLVLFYSEMEEKVSSIIRARLHFKGDAILENFVFNTHESMLRRVKKSEISDILKKFGCSDSYLTSQLSEEDLGYYSTIINNRHKVAHKSGVQVTLSQLERGLVSAEKILDALPNCLTEQFLC